MGHSNGKLAMTRIINLQKLRDHGVDVPYGATGRRKMKCPHCSHRRTDKRDKSLYVNLDHGVARCFYCDWKLYFAEDDDWRSRNYNAGNFQPKYSKKTKLKLKMDPKKYNVNNELSEKVKTYFKERGIPLEVVQEMGITEQVEWMPQTRKPGNTIAFPYREGGQLVNCKYRDGAKNFKLMSGAELIPWNIDAIADTPECIITEGEFDALSYMAIGRKDVVSVPNGATTNLTYLDRFVESHFERKQVIYVSVDADARGMDLQRELVRRLGEDRCRLVAYAEGCKDANEMLVKHGPEALAGALTEAREIPLEGVFTAADVAEGMHHLFKHGLQPGKTLDMGDLDKLLSLETGRLMVLTGIPGDGKSEWLDEMAVRLNLHHGWRVAFFSPENFPVELHLQKLVEKLIGKGFKEGEMSRMEYESAMDHLTENFIDILPEENYSVDLILSKAEALVRRRGIHVLAIDPYNCLEHRIPNGQSETQYISEFLERLRSFARRKQVLVILAAHPTKLKLDPATKKFPVPTMYDIAGSAAFFNKSDYGIAVERDREADVTRLHVQKVKFRHLGRCGQVSFKYNTCNGRYLPYTEGLTPDLPDPEPEWDNTNWLARLQQEKEKNAQGVLDLHTDDAQAKEEGEAGKQA